MSRATQLHVAQVNIATLRAPIDDPATAAFRDGLDVVNAAAEAAPGFVWRLQSDDGDATSIRVSPDPLAIVNLTVWSTIDALFEFAYRGLHRDYLRRRGEWFTDAGRESAVWMIPAGTTPTVAEALARVEFLRLFGESPYVFGAVRSHPELVMIDHPLDDEVAIGLITELDTELSSYPGAHFFELSAEQVSPGSGSFVVAWLDGEPVGCGAFRMLDANRAEIKRMYVRSGGRGHKIGAAVLHQLEQRAVTTGATELLLETAMYLGPAVGLYKKAGFEPCAPWGQYADSPDSACFSKRLRQ